MSEPAGGRLGEVSDPTQFTRHPVCQLPSGLHWRRVTLVHRRASEISHPAWKRETWDGSLRFPEGGARPSGPPQWAPGKRKQSPNSMQNTLFFSHPPPEPAKSSRRVTRLDPTVAEPGVPPRSLWVCGLPQGRLRRYAQPVLRTVHSGTPYITKHAVGMAIHGWMDGCPPAKVSPQPRETLLAHPQSAARPRSTSGDCRASRALAGNDLGLGRRPGTAVRIQLGAGRFGSFSSSFFLFFLFLFFFFLLVSFSWFFFFSLFCPTPNPAANIRQQRHRPTQ